MLHYIHILHTSLLRAAEVVRAALHEGVVGAAEHRLGLAERIDLAVAGLIINTMMMCSIAILDMTASISINMLIMISLISITVMSSSISSIIIAITITIS